MVQASAHSEGVCGPAATSVIQRERCRGDSHLGRIRLACTRFRERKEHVILKGLSMPNISTVQLQIKHTTALQSPTAPREVAVDYNIGFTQAEVDARANFQVKVSLVSIDDNVLPVTSFNLTAAPGTVSRAERKTFQRRQLDEEPDFEIIVDSQGHPHRIPSEMPDSWRAKVTVTHLPGPTFGNASGVSADVSGSWGAEGND